MVKLINGVVQIENNFSFLVCKEFSDLHEGVGIRCYCWSCDLKVCLSYQAMKEMPTPFIIFCTECAEHFNENKNKIWV